MEITTADTRRALSRANKSASRALDGAQDVALRKLRRARRDVVKAGDRASRSATELGETVHAWMEDMPHLAALVALAAGVILGAALRPRR